jgi:aldehyde:ferredoxin oxidoreductase
VRQSWQQRILHIDLSSGATGIEDVSAADSAGFIGSRGLNAKLLWQGIGKGVDPFSPGNPLIFGTGVLTGTTVPSSGRTTVTCKGPATGRYLKTNGGGHWGNELRLAGWDYVVVTGASAEPVYVWIDDDAVEIRPAGQFWGKGIKESTYAIRDELDDDAVQLALIGPAGENRGMFALISLSVHHACGRGGAGAVMGSKNLKGIAVRGSGAVTVAHPQEFYQLALQAMEANNNDSSTLGRGMFGTSGGVVGTNETDTLPSFNYRQGHIDGANRISGQHLVEAGYLTGRVACHACQTACHRFVTDRNGPYGDVQGAGPEYETMAALGSNCGNTDVRAVMMANQLCNDLGLDTISTGNTIAWAMESYENGLITKADADGLELTWGNGEAIVRLVEKIARREGIGDLLAQGVMRASQQIGGDSWKWAVQTRGLEQSMVDTRGSKGYALAFAVNPRGPDHLATEALAEYGETVEAQALIEEITGSTKYADPLLTDKRAEIIRWHEDCYAATDSLGVCVFTSTAAYGVNPENMAGLFSLATGIDMTAEELMLAGRRIVTLEHCFNLREGATRDEFTLPWRLMNENQRDPMFAPWRNSQEELDLMLDEYYRLHGWDNLTTRPTEETLRMLGIYDLVRGKTG